MKKNMLFVFGALIIGLASCKKEEIALRATADVFVIVKTVGSGTEMDTVYGMALHVFANKAMQTVTASHESDPGISYTLKAYDGYPYDFYFETDEDAFSMAMPEVGDYLFDVLAQSAETASLSDELLDDLIFPAANFVCTFDTDKDEMKISWDKIDDADYLVVRMYDEDEKMVFSSAAQAGTVKDYAFGAAKAGWLNGKSPVDGKAYVIELDAYMYEPGKSDLDLQAKSITLQEVTWGE